MNIRRPVLQPEASDLWILYTGAACVFLIGLLFMLNVGGIANRLFGHVARFVPAGRAAPRIFRVVGAGWMIVATLMLTPEIVASLR